MKTKRLLALIIAVIMLLGALPLSSSAASSGGAYVAKMYICTRTKITGHVWLYFENLTDHEITVGCYKLPKGQGVTVSAYNTARKDGKGNYYNIDGYCLNKYGSGSTTCASMNLTASQLDTVNKKILERNSWSGTKNCCYFACNAWNSVASSKLKIYLVPSMIGSQLKKIKCSTPHFYYPEKSQCLKQVGTGSSATLKQCKDGSFNRLVG